MPEIIEQHYLYIDTAAFCENVLSTFTGFLFMYLWLQCLPGDFYLLGLFLFSFIFISKFTWLVGSHYVTWNSVPAKFTWLVGSHYVTWNSVPAKFTWLVGSHYVTWNSVPAKFMWLVGSHYVTWNSVRAKHLLSDYFLPRHNICSMC